MIAAPKVSVHRQLRKHPCLYLTSELGMTASNPYVVSLHTTSSGCTWQRVLRMYLSPNLLYWTGSHSLKCILAACLGHMSRNCTAGNCFVPGVFRCCAWHVPSEILRPIGRAAGNIAAEWSGGSPIHGSSAGYDGNQPLELVLLNIGSNYLKHCFLQRRQSSGALLPNIGSVFPTSFGGHTSETPRAKGCGQWHGPTRMSVSQNRPLIPWDLTKS